MAAKRQAVAYCRSPSEKSRAAQTQAIEAWAARRRFEIVEWFADASRVAGAQFLSADAAAHHVGFLVVGFVPRYPAEKRLLEAMRVAHAYGAYEHAIAFGQRTSLHGRLRLMRGGRRARYG